MLDADTIDAVTRLVDAFRKLFEVLGPRWTFLFAVLVFGALFTYHHLRVRRIDRLWRMVIAAKDETIDQINQQNRQLRVATMASGKIFSKEEAAAIVYSDESDSESKSD
jgi:hypothetical protein